MTLAREAGPAGIVHVAASAGRVEGLAELIWRLAPEIETIPLPPWDSFPYDRTSPSRLVMGLRTTALAALARPATRPRLVIATSEALLQRVPPRSFWERVTLRWDVGTQLDLAALPAGLRRIGYHEDERVDEAGEFAIRGHVIDIFPAGYRLPVRVEHEEGRITGLASFDAASQRTSDHFDALALGPVSEAVLPEGETAPDLPEAGLEHRLPDIVPGLETLFDYLPEATIVVEPRAEDRAEAFLEQVRDAYESRVRLGGGTVHPPRPERLYLDREERDGRLADRTVTRWIDGPDDAPEVPHFALAAKPAEALARFVKAEAGAGRRVVLAAGCERDLAELSRRAVRAKTGHVVPAEDWNGVLDAEPGTLLSLAAPIERGFVMPEDGVTVVAGADLMGSRTASGTERATLPVFGEEAFHLGDTVIHLDHGVGILRGLETIEAGPEGARDLIRLEYAHDAKLMVPSDEVDLVWRYGAAGTAVSLDKLDGDSWPKRRAKVEAELNKAARELARLSAERHAARAPKLVPQRRGYERFVARFPFAETPDQHAAIDDILHDLASGHAMDRLVCGDVGFGKTELALRAAAAAALAGRQVALVAPTTVLVRQHLQTFQRRFADLGIEIGHLSRLVTPAEAHEVREGLADGRIRVVIGTHALAAKGTTFKDLGLLIVDEEQHFGAADKAKLRALGADAHVLTLTATPIPRTLQSALVGLQEVSVLTTPPAERQPVRTFVLPFDNVTVRTALIRERGRRGQSFVVCPQVEDIAPMAERLRRLVPELEIFVAHGKLPAAEIDDTMVRFADGEGDVLLATNIIESGLDVPRANTILIWRPDRFGLGQLHQLRGRVGRGRVRGSAYLMADPEHELSEETTKRLATLENHDRLGAGFAISAEDLDQRGGGDLLGDTQAGHVKLIGAGLYRRLLERALVAARGETPEEDWSPELHIGLAGRLPADYVPEDEVRLNLYARIALGSEREETLLDEVEDRFGPVPEPVTSLMALARLRRLCRAAGIARIDAGPQAIALTFKDRPESDSALAAAVADRSRHLSWRRNRLVLDRAITDDGARLEAIEELVVSLAREPETRSPRGEKVADKEAAIA